jgi:hypothetical protein
VIVPAGAVVVDAEIVGIVCTALVRHVQAERIGDPAVLRLLDELRTVADRPADGGRGIPAHDGPSESVADYSERTGKPPTTVRRWCRLGRLAATRRDDGRWEIYANATTNGSSGSRVSSAP